MRTAAIYLSFISGMAGMVWFAGSLTHVHSPACYEIFHHLDGIPHFAVKGENDWELVVPSMRSGVEVVVIDPGHGGRDPGCRAHGFQEKDIALNIALKLGEKIRREMPGIKVIYTRERDVFVPLHERASIANKNDADLFISIHVNSARNTAVFGTETFVMGYHKAGENLEAAKENLAVAQRENEVILLEEDYEMHYGNFDPHSEIGHILLSMVQDAFIGQSLLFASKVEDAFTERANRKSRGVKQAGFVVLRATTMPSVLIETGFLTNRQEAMFLGSAAGQEKLAGSIFEALHEYRIAVLGTEQPLASGGAQNKEISINTNHNASSPSQAQPVKLSPEVQFKVQLASLPRRIDVRQNPWKNVRNLEVWDTGQDFKYLAGGFRNYEECHSAWQELRKKGFDDAFIIALRNGERIPVQEARNMADAR